MKIKSMKKHILILILFFSVLFLIGYGLYGLATYSPYELKHLKEEKIANQVLTKLAGQLAKKYHLKVVGHSAEMPEGIINKLGLIFHIYQSLTREEIREILVDCVEAFLIEINSNKEIRLYLKVYPFTADNVSIILGIYQTNGKNIYDPEISSAWASRGKLRYATEEKGQKYGYKNEYEESFEEAEELVKQSKKDQMEE